MKRRNYYALAMLIFIGAVLVRIVCWPSTGFFCDVPGQIYAIESGSYLIQFPGYAPYHLLAALLATCTTSVTEALLLLSFCSGMISLLYVMLAARELQGDRAAILSGVVMAFAVLPVYFSVSGTSYTMDMICVAGMMYHGIKFIRASPRLLQHYLIVLFWLCCGIIMRPLSAIWLIPALCFLNFWARNLHIWILSLVLILSACSLYICITVPFYGSTQAFLDSSRIVSGQLEGTSIKNLTTNLFRVAMYPAYTLHVWLCFSLLALLLNIRKIKSRESLYVAGLALPFFIILLRYIPHAGYYCLLMPVLALFPWTTLKAPKSLVSWPIGFSLVLFLAISSLQLFVLHPIRITGLYSAVANTYFLQYSRQGLKQGYYETLSSALYKGGGDLRQLVPLNRQKQIEQEIRNADHIRHVTQK